MKVVHVVSEHRKGSYSNCFVRNTLISTLCDEIRWNFSLSKIREYIRQRLIDWQGPRKEPFGRFDNMTQWDIHYTVGKIGKSQKLVRKHMPELAVLWHAIGTSQRYDAGHSSTRDHCCVRPWCHLSDLT